jgi:hypothetical protein
MMCSSSLDRLAGSQRVLVSDFAAAARSRRRAEGSFGVSDVILLAIGSGASTRRWPSGRVAEGRQARRNENYGWTQASRGVGRRERL